MKMMQFCNERGNLGRNIFVEDSVGNSALNAASNTFIVLALRRVYKEEILLTLQAGFVRMS